MWPRMPRAGWLALGAAGAALAGTRSEPVIAVVLAGALLPLLVAAGLGGRRRTMLVLIGALAILGRILLELVGPSPALPPPSGADPAGVKRAEVVSLSTPLGGMQRAVIDVQVPTNDQRVYAWLPRYPVLAPYDVIEFSGVLEAPDQETEFGRYLARSGIGYTARIRHVEVVGRGDDALAELEQVRRAAAEILARVVPAPQAGLAAGLLIGLRDQVPRDVADDFRVAGLSHVVAISGFHLALVVALAGLCLRWLARRPRSILLLILVWAYVLVAGAAPSVVRAALMATVVIGAREAGRRGQAPDALALAALGMLLVEPAVIDEIGFQLSVAATAGLLVWAAPLSNWLAARLPRRVPRLLIEATAVSLAAQAATLPLVLLHFGRLSTVAPLANLLVAPLVAPAMLAGGLALVAGALVALGLPAILLAPVSYVSALSLGGLIAVAHVCASLPGASISLPPPLEVVLALLTAGLLAGALRRTGSGSTASLVTLVGRAEVEAAAHGHAGQRPGQGVGAPTARGRHRRSRRLRWAAALAGLAVTAVIVGSAQPDGRLRMTVLDVGQGDAILLEGPRGGRILVDTGPDPDVLLARLDARLPAWDRRLDLVVLTHPHEDHVAGLALLLNRYQIGAVAETGMTGLGPGDAAYRRRLTELGRQTRSLAAGDRIELDGVAIDIRWPLPGSVPLRASSDGKQVNNVSLVLDFTFGERRFLLTGDVEEQIDPLLLARGIAAAGRPLDVLKVAHHGSRTATTAAFVEGLRPSIAVVSAGADNPYGHPSPGTVARLREVGATLYRTDLDGSIQISTDGRDLRTHASGVRRTAVAVLARSPPGVGFCPIPGS